MSSREQILKKISKNKPMSRLGLEEIHFESSYTNPKEKFGEILTAIGGSVLTLRSRKDLEKALDEKYAEAAIRATNLPELKNWATADLSVADPHELKNVQLAVLNGRFGVAENGAIWLSDLNTEHRVLPFITEYLVLVIDAQDIVENMHDAFRKLGEISEGWGCFIAGPSKTADIEQSLVIGAHGPRGMMAVLIADS